MTTTGREERLERLAERFNLSADALLEELEETAQALPAASSNPTDALSDDERAALDELGMGLAPPSHVATEKLKAMERAHQMRTAGYTSKELAGLLGVSESRVRQRHSNRELIATKGQQGELRYPRWQCAAGALLPHLPEVLRAIPKTVPLIAVERFMTEPNQALSLAGEPGSPVVWLVCGGDPTSVIEIAETLNVGL